MLDGVHVLTKFISESDLKVQKNTWFAEILRKELKIQAKYENPSIPIIEEPSKLFSLIKALDCLQLVVKNVHIRVEHISEEESNSAFGLVLEELRINTYNENTKSQGFYQR